MSTKDGLDQATFERLLEMHGTRVERWPAALREPLARLLEHSDAASRLWAEAAELDAWLGAVPEIEPAADLVARIASLPALHPRPERVGWWPFENPLGPLLAWGAATLLGVALGVLATPELDLDLDDDTDAAADVFVSDEGDVVGEDGLDEWTEVSGLVMGAEWVPEDE